MARKTAVPLSIDIEPRSWPFWLMDLKQGMGAHAFDLGLARVLWGIGLSSHEAAYNLRVKAIDAQIAKERAEQFVAAVMKRRGMAPPVQNGTWVGP